MGLLSLFPLLLRERPGERILPWTAGETSPVSLEIQMTSWKEIASNMVKVLFLPASIALASIALLHGATYGLIQAFLPTLTVQELGWLDTSYSGLVATAGLTAGIIGIFIASPLLDKLGTIKGLKLFIGGLAFILSLIHI